MPSSVDNEFASLSAVYGPGLSMQDMRLRKYGGPTVPAKSVNDLEYAYWGPGTTLSNADKKLANLQSATGKAGSIDDLTSQSIGAPAPFPTLMTFPSQASCDVLYTPAPTILITAQSTTTIAGGVLVPPTDAKFKFRGAGGFAVGVGFPLTTVVAPNSRHNYAFATPANCGESFNFNGTEFEVMYYLASTSGSVRLRIDGKRVTALPVVSLTANGSRYMWKVTFPGVETHRIDIDHGYNHFGGVYVAPGNTITAVAPFTKRCLLFGDSIINGSTSTTGLSNGTWKQLFDKYCGIDDIWDIAEGGTGYVNRGTNPGVTTENLQARINDVLNWSPNIVITFAGTNDTLTATDAQMRTAAQQLYTSLRTLPISVENYVWGTWCPTVVPHANVVSHDQVLREECAAKGFPFWATYSGACYGRNGSLLGNIGPVIRNASDVSNFIQADLTHPTDAGNTRIAQMGQLAMQLMAPSL